MELVLGNDACALVINWLRVQLDLTGWSGIHVSSTVPNPRPAEFVQVVRTGGPLRDLVVDDAQLTVDSWSTSDEDAHDLAQMCRALLHAATGRQLAGHQVYRVVEFAGPALLADPLSDTPRYRASYQVPVRCTVTTAGS